MFGIRSKILENPILFSKIFLVTGFICALTASLTSGENLEGIPWDYSYYHLNAIAFSAYLSAFYLVTLVGTPKWSNKWRNFTLLVVFCSFSTIGDEIAGNGSEVDWQDLFRIVTTLTIYAYTSKRKLINKMMYDIWHNIESFFKAFSNEVAMFFIGGFGAVYTTSTLSVTLNKKQRWLRYLSGAILAVLLPSGISELIDYDFGVWSICLLAYISGTLGVEGVTRLIVGYINKHKNDTAKDN